MATEKIFVRKECNRCVNCFLEPTFAILRICGLSGVVPIGKSCEALADKSTKPRFRWRDILSVFMLWSHSLYMIALCVIIYWGNETYQKMADDMAVLMVIRHMFGKKYQLILLIVSAISCFQGAVNCTLINFSRNRDAVTEKFCKLWKECNKDLYIDTDGKSGKWRIILAQRIILYGILPLEMSLVFLFWIYFFGHNDLNQWPWLSLSQIILVFGIFVVAPCWLILVMTLCFVYFVSICRLIKWKFNAIVDELRQLSERPETITSVKMVHAKHHKICKMVEATDKFICNYIFATYAMSLPSICIVLHLLYSESKDTTLNMFLGIIAVSLIFMVLAVTLSCGSVTSSGHRPKEVLHNVSILAVPKEIRLEINIFLERLNGPTIGFTCLDFFVVTSGTLTSIASVVVTYLLMYLQFNQSRKIN